MFLEKYQLLRDIPALQAYALELLTAVDAFCRENGIPYYLGEGSLLGAVRHRGFIPWDDDIDLLMRRDDYDRFIELARQSFPADYALDCMETNPLHWTICAKIQIKRPTPFLQTRVHGIGLYDGPHIDVFPLDRVPRKGSIYQRFLGFKIDAFKVMLWLKTGYTDRIYSWKRRLIAMASRFYSVRRIQTILDSSMRRYNRKPYHYLVNYGSLYPVSRQTFPEDWYGTPQEAEFEGHKFFIPEHAEEILRGIYGDFEELPPMSGRLPKHSFIKRGEKNIDERSPKNQ